MNVGCSGSGAGVSDEQMVGTLAGCCKMSCQVSENESEELFKGPHVSVTSEVDAQCSCELLIISENSKHSCCLAGG